MSSLHKPCPLRPLLQRTLTVVLCVSTLQWRGEEREREAGGGEGGMGERVMFHPLPPLPLESSRLATDAKPLANYERRKWKQAAEREKLKRTKSDQWLRFTCSLLTRREGRSSVANRAIPLCQRERKGKQRVACWLRNGKAASRVFLE